MRSLKALSEPERIAHLRNLCRTDLYFLLRYVLRRPDVEHPWLLDRIREVQENPDEFIDLWAREHFKSSIITFGLTIQDVLKSHGDNPLADKEVTIGIFSHNRSIAKDFLKQIKRELEDNELLKELFPDIFYEQPDKQSPKWSEDEGLIVKRKSNPKESTIEAWGLVDGQPTGKHFNVLVYDDIVTEKSVTSSLMINKTTKMLELSYNLGTDGGVRRFIGTIYDDCDTYSVILKRKTATPRIYPATHNGKSSGTPVLMSKKKLSEKIRDMSIYTFSCQMLLDPVPADNAYFKKDQFIIEEEMPETYNVYGCSDYAVTEDGGDSTEHGIFGLDHLGRPWIFDWWSGQTAPDIWIETQLDMVEEWEPFVWVGETGPIRRSIEPFLEKRMEERGEYVTLEWLPNIGNKAIRARSFQMLATHYGIRMIKADWNQDLIFQLMRFPKSTLDDKVDVCSLFGRALKETFAAPLPDKTEKIKLDRWDRAFNRLEEPTWKTV